MFVVCLLCVLCECGLIGGLLLFVCRVFVWCVMVVCCGRVDRLFVVCCLYVVCMPFVA